MSLNVIILFVAVVAYYAYSKGRARGQRENIAKAVARIIQGK
ncbi:hypothetical protein QF035_011251 [Streptomyces umbrinus]|uniref:Uncharacterized protein n=1 Tax=Streptomyces umbrinus TaxID=67370 RepID=A0ABU0TD33_9ACTN|nr:hypothetical protein [Streptomyces umbrinus]MDQ1033582.1 hypothetical protein [Streptomyces umbrinus]